MGFLLNTFLITVVFSQLVMAGRMYDPEIGRFISWDPTGYVDGMGLYNGYFAERFALDPTGTEVIVESVTKNGNKATKIVLTVTFVDKCGNKLTEEKFKQFQDRYKKGVEGAFTGKSKNGKHEWKTEVEIREGKKLDGSEHKVEIVDKVEGSSAEESVPGRSKLGSSKIEIRKDTLSKRSDKSGSTELVGAHETGHSMNLPHDHIPGSLMNKTTGDNNIVIDSVHINLIQDSYSRGLLNK